MQNEPYKPAGYCPNCGYAIDPGTCPECGHEFTAHQLHRRPYWVENRIRIKRLLIAVGIIIVFACLWYAYSYTNWPSHLPTSWLLKLQGDGNDRSSQELLRRFNSYSLSAAESRQFFANALEVPNSLGTRSSHPAGVPVTVSFVGHLRLPRPQRYRYQLCMTEWELRVDDAIVSPLDHRSKEEGWPDVWRSSLGHTWTSEGYGYIFDLPALTPGTYQVSLTGTVEIRRRPPGPPPPPLPIAIRQQIVVEDKPITDYINPTWSTELAERIKKRISANPNLEPSGGRLDLNISVFANDPPSPVAARIWWRPAGQGAFRRTSTTFVARSTGGFGYVARLMDDFDPNVFKHVDLRLIPEIGIAFDASLTEFFSGVIEWTNLPIQGVTYQSPPEQPQASKGRSVFQIDLSEPQAVRAATQPAATP